MKMSDHSLLLGVVGGAIIAVATMKYGERIKNYCQEVYETRLESRFGFNHRPEVPPPTLTPEEEWKANAKEFGYEGAAIAVINTDGLFAFLQTKNKDGNPQCELPGGKVEKADGGDSVTTALREFEEETGIQLTRGDVKLDSRMETTGGTTGFPSIQYVSKPQPDSLIEGNENMFWSALYKYEQNNEWYARFEGAPTEVRKFNTYFINQHVEDLQTCGGKVVPLVIQ